MIYHEPTGKYVVIARYEVHDYAKLEVFETDSVERARRVFKALSSYWRDDMHMYKSTNKHWSVVVEQPLYNEPGFVWEIRCDEHGHMMDIHPSVSIRRHTDDRDLAAGVD